MREILKENTEKNLVGEWLWRKKEGKVSAFAELQSSVLFVPVLRCVNGPRRVTGRYPSAEASQPILPLGSFRPPLKRRLGFFSKGHILGIIVSPPTCKH